MPPLFSDVFSMLYFIDFGFGVLFVGTGLTGRLVPAEPHCFKCGYPYDTEARPVRCPECGEVLSENLIKRTRWVRSPKLIVIGAVILFFGFSTMIVQDSPFVRGAMASVVPTRGLIARLNGSEYSGLSEPALWGELQTRMPLAPKDRDRLVEELIARVDGEFTWMFLSTPGVDIWLGKELADGPHGSEHIDQALEIVENTDLVSDGAFKVNIVLKALYTTPVGALTPEQYDRLVRFSFDAVETKPFNGQMAYTIGGSAWLTAESTKGRLTPEQQVRFRNDADALAGK